MIRLASLLLLIATGAAAADPVVDIRRVPDDGIQPQVAVGADGAVHLIYYKGEAGGGDVFYVRSRDAGKTFSAPLRVNSRAGSAIAAGTIRGAQLALGAGDRVHVAWNGAKGGEHGAPMLYTRIKEDGSAFEPERDLMTKTEHLDGGGSVAADARGNVFVVWHASERDGAPGEDGRAVWVARSTDGGATFAPEARANREDTGACGCCGLRAYAGEDGTLYTLYRTATRVVTRDMHLLTSADAGKSFRNAKVDGWEVPACVMSMASFAQGPTGLFAAWETKDDVYFGAIDAKSATIPERVKGFGSGARRKHPALAVSSRGEMLLAWTEGTAWKRGGALAWRLYDAERAPVIEQGGRRDGVPVWSFPAVFATPAGDFVVLY